MNGAIIAIVNAKGGSGATTIALETARSMRRAGSKVAVVDGDLSGRRNVAVLLDSVRAFDAARTMNVYSSIQREGLTAVELTGILDNSFALRVEDVEKLVIELENENDVILVDAPTPFSAALRPFMQRASRIVVADYAASRTVFTEPRFERISGW